MPKRHELARALADLMRQHAFEVEGALASHTEWKRWLRDAVIRGYCEQGSDEIGRDDRCALGRWLYSLPPAELPRGVYEDATELHARFHRHASVVVQYLESGHIAMARAAMNPDSDFARASEDLVCLLEAWRDAA